MNIIFLTMSRISNISSRGIYTDLMRKFRNEGHNVYIVTPHERSLKKPTELTINNGVRILGVRTLNLQKTNIIEKGFGQILVERQYKKAIKHYLSGISFDLILYSTPPITFSKVISYLKNNNNCAKSYLLLKDIFPQNAVDIGMMTKNGLEGFLYRFFRKKEMKLYALSDYIGCMSPANVKYLLEHNPSLASDKVEVAPNSFELNLPEITDEKEIKLKELNDKHFIRKKYNIPTDVPVFIYGGNLGKPQGIPFLIECLSANANRNDCFFVIIGTGTEMNNLREWYLKERPLSVKVMDGLPTNEYDMLVSTCDVGMIFLDHRFTIPNFPSRILSYMENKIPVICATDPVSDMGRIAEENGFGYWCESNSVEAFTSMLDRMIHSDLKAMGEKAYEFLKNNYLIEYTYNRIMSHV